MAPLPNFLLPSHSENDFRVLRGNPPNRICFASTHKNALRDNAGSFAHWTPFKFSIPFKQGVQQEFFAGTKIVLQESNYGFWRGLTQEEASCVKDWMVAQGGRVYLKDFFNCSISLGERSIDNQETPLGACFSAAKYQKDPSAAHHILNLMKASYDQMLSIDKPAFVSCPPPRAGKDFDLPTWLATRLASHIGSPFVELGVWKGNKGQLKEVPNEKKWGTLSDVGFQVEPKILKSGGAIILIDDIYQSGTTINFLRSMLTKGGVAKASAMTIVKAARDTDNQ